MAYKIPFSGRAHQYTQEEIDLVSQVMQQAEPLTQGRFRDEFEQAFARYHGVEHCFTVCNATAGLEMAAQLCLLEPGDEVIIPSHTFTSSAYPFLKKGGRLVWADIDLATRVVDAACIEKVLTPKSKVVVVPHLYGFLADMPAIMELAARAELLVIEDAAQNIGTELGGRKAGAFGDMAVFSFHSHKNVTTLGEGGMLVVRDPEVAEVAPMLRHNGHCGFDFDREDYWVPAMGNVDLPTLRGRRLMPNNYCLGEVECALGAKLLERLDQINGRKRRRALEFMDALADFEELEFHREDSARHNYHLLAARLTKGKRDRFIRAMANEKSIQCVVQYYPLHRYDFYQKAGMGQADVPNTDAFFDNMVSFPFQQSLTDQDLAYQIDSARDVLRSL